jgi:hypothetical protein
MLTAGLAAMAGSAPAVNRPALSAVTVITRHNLDILTPLPARSPGGHP